MANIDDFLDNELTDKKEKEALKNKGVNEYTNKSAIIQTLIEAAKSGDVKAALWLLENSSKEKSKKHKDSPLDKARKQANGKKQGK